jgi:sugar/nucleoside kinase (ribokinase family)
VADSSAPYVVCVGAATLDTILAVPRHPAPDDRVVASALVRAGGGPAGTAAVALARLGVRVFFFGAVGDDDAGDAIRAGLEDEGVDVSELTVEAGARSIESAILVGGANRTIVTHLGTAAPVELAPRARDLCRGAAWTHVDQIGYPAIAGLDVRLSVDGGNPIPELDLRRVTLYSPNEAALAALFPGDVETGARTALAAGADLVVVTRGGEGSLALTAEGKVVASPAFDVEVVSTLGAGDVFHGALLAQLVREAPLPEALAAANACAALSCRALDGRSAIPTADELERAAVVVR